MTGSPAWTPSAEEWRAAFHQAAILIALAMLVDPEWPTSTRIGEDGGRTESYADGRKRINRKTFEGEIVARHAGIVAERRLFPLGAWVADGYDIWRIRMLYAVSRRHADRNLDTPMIEALLAPSLRRPPHDALESLPFLARAEDLVQAHHAAIWHVARRLLADFSLDDEDLWDAIRDALAYELDLRNTKP